MEEGDFRASHSSYLESSVQLSSLGICATTVLSLAEPSRQASASPVMQVNPGYDVTSYAL